MLKFGINQKAFIRKIRNKKTCLIILENSNGLTATITNYGCRLVNLFVPDHRGNFKDVIAGYKTLNDYQKSSDPYHGAVIGRYCNRISGASFELDGFKYSLPINDKANSLHGGPNGFHSVVWDVVQVDNSSVTLNYFSKHMDEGYPGNLDVSVCYTLLPDNALKITYFAKSDMTTVINLTNHAYFNLNGSDHRNILRHRIQLRADKFTPIDEMMLPTGKISGVAGTPFDFRRPYTIASRIDDHSEQLRLGNGYNHNFVLNKHAPKTEVGNVIGDESGIKMTIYSDQPGIQLYTGNHFRGDNLMKAGNRDNFRNYLALETQHFPDSPNHGDFPSTMLRPDNVFESFTIFKFS